MNIGDPQTNAKMTEADYAKAANPEHYSILERIRFLEKQVDVLERQCPQFASELHTRIDTIQKAIGPTNGPVPTPQADAPLPHERWDSERMS